MVRVVINKKSRFLFFDGPNCVCLSRLPRPGARGRVFGCADLQPAAPPWPWRVRVVRHVAGRTALQRGAPRDPTGPLMTRHIHVTQFSRRVQFCVPNTFQPNNYPSVDAHRRRNGVGGITSTRMGMCLKHSSLVSTTPDEQTACCTQACGSTCTLAWEARRASTVELTNTITCTA